MDYTAHETITHRMTVEENGWTIEVEADLGVYIIHEQMVRYYPDGSGYPGFYDVEVEDIRSMVIEDASHTNPILDWIIQRGEDMPRFIQNWLTRKMEGIVEPFVWEAEVA